MMLALTRRIKVEMERGRWMDEYLDGWVMNGWVGE